MDLGWAGLGDVPAQLGSLYNELAKYCQDNSLPLHMSGLTRTLLAFSKDADYPCG